MWDLFFFSNPGPRFARSRVRGVHFTAEVQNTVQHRQQELQDLEQRQPAFGKCGDECPPWRCALVHSAVLLLNKLNLRLNKTHLNGENRCSGTWRGRCGLARTRERLVSESVHVPALWWGQAAEWAAARDSPNCTIGDLPKIPERRRTPVLHRNDISWNSHAASVPLMSSAVERRKRWWRGGGSWNKKNKRKKDKRLIQVNKLTRATRVLPGFLTKVNPPGSNRM